MRNAISPELSLAQELPTFVPAVNLVPFSTQQFRSATLALVNAAIPGITEKCLLSSYAFGVANRSTKGDMLGRSKLFFAERYGSSSTMGHGGGARVGADARFQVKGIGATPVLAKRGVNFCYRNGEMLLAEAVRETIWGEILHIALPHGAVRSPGVICTGTHCALPENDVTGIRLERGLHIRQNAARLAHFMRTPFFKPSDSVQRSWLSDHDRVVTAIAEMEPFLPQVSDEESTEPRERLTARLVTLTERLAEQLSAARAKRLVHGALVHSNFCLDGRWIDYGSTHWSPVHATGKHYSPPFWNDEDGTVQALHSFAWQLKKYLTKSQGANDHDWLVAVFRRELDFRQKIEFLSLAGYSEKILSSMNRLDFSAGLALGMAILAVARSGRNARFTGEDENLRSYGDYDVGRLLARLQIASDAAEAERVLDDSIHDATLSRQFLKAHIHFRVAYEAAAVAQGESLEGCRRRIAAKLLNRSAHLKLLEGPNLMDEINGRLDQTRSDPQQRRDSLGRLLSDVRDKASILLGDHDGTLNSASAQALSTVDTSNSSEQSWSAMIKALDPNIYGVLKDREIAQAISST